MMIVFGKFVGCHYNKILISYFLQICTSNHMFARAIWGKLPKCVFENFEIARVKRG